MNLREDHSEIALKKGGISAAPYIFILLLFIR